MSIIKINGSLGEGGGQVLRIALCLSALYKIPVEINNIRAGRPKPGLAAQHLKGVELLKDMCNAKTKGAHIGSTSLEFYPDELSAKKTKFEVDTKTAGCISLLAQVAIPCALFMPSQETIIFVLKGGTNVAMGPHIEYLTEVFKPYLNKFGGDFSFSIVKRGYYPKGGGEVHLYVKPIQHLEGITLLDPGLPKVISGSSYVAGSFNINEAYKIADECKNTIINTLTENNIKVPPINIESYREDRNMAVGNGCGINVMYHTTTGCIFGGSGLKSPPGREKGESSIGIIAAKQILEPILKKSCIDEYMQDQLIILMALARGTSKIRINSKHLTNHANTAIEIAKIMLGSRGLHFNLSETKMTENSIAYDLECNGCNLINSYLI